MNALKELTRANVAGMSNIDPLLSDRLKMTPGGARTIATGIVASFRKDKIQWPDEITLPPIDGDTRPHMSYVWQFLRAAGILEKMPQARTSRVKSRKGSIVFQYRIVDEARAEMFLKLNEYAPIEPGQIALPLVTETATKE